MKILFKPSDYKQIDKARTFEDLLQVAMDVLRRFPGKAAMVCGPITTGGYGDINKNLLLFKETIKRLQNDGVLIFSQMPFEKKMQEIKEIDHCKGGLHLLESFYQPIFESEFVDTLIFLPNWKSSLGARWEHDQAIRLGLKIVYL